MKFMFPAVFLKASSFSVKCLSEKGRWYHVSVLKSTTRLQVTLGNLFYSRPTFVFSKIQPFFFHNW